MRSLSPILTGLIFELLILRYIFPMTLAKALLVDIAMNAASALAGAVIIPLVGLLWEIFPGMVIYPIFHMGTFNPLTWAATCLMATFVSTGIEVFVVTKAFSFETTKRRFWSIALANAGSTAIAWASLLMHPARL